MLIVNGNNIKLTKGDTLTLEVSLTKDGEAYIPDQSDSIRFALSKGFVGDRKYQFILSVPISNESLMFTVPAEDTKRLSYDTYDYDVEITHGDGSVDTVIIGKLEITGEVL